MISASRIAIATLGLLLIGGGDAAMAQTRTTTNMRDCFTDDGYGRIRSCSQGFKKANKKWRASAGSVGFKRKQPKL